MIRSAWDKRAKVTWGSCAYHVVPFHDALRSQHWEDVVPLLVCLRFGSFLSLGRFTPFAHTN